MSVIGHTLSTNERFPVDSPFIETKTNYDDLLISKIFALAQRRQYPCHLFRNLIPSFLAGCIQRERLFNNVTQLFFNIFCLHTGEAAIADFVSIFYRAFPVARFCVATQSNCVHIGLKSLYVFYSLCFLPTCELVKGPFEQQCQYLFNDAFIKMQHTRNLIFYLAVGAIDRFPESEGIMIMCIFSHDTQCPDNRMCLAFQTFFGAITKLSVLRVETAFSK
jgi:hypothetical protein